MYTVIKACQGRSIIVSDSPDHARVEITGQRRFLPLPPSGNPAASYTIDGNMTPILLEETPGSEQVLVKTYKGDYIKLAIEDRTLGIYIENDVSLTTNGNLRINVAKNIEVQSGENITTHSGKNTTILANGSLSITSNSTGAVNIGGGFKAIIKDTVYIKDMSTMRVESPCVSVDNSEIQKCGIQSCRIGSLSVGSCSCPCC